MPVRVSDWLSWLGRGCAGWHHPTKALGAQCCLICSVFLALFHFSPLTMKFILVTIALAVLLRDTFGDIQPQKNFDLKKFAGKWYRVGLADDSPSFALFRNKLTISMGIVEPKDNGDVNMTMWRMIRSTGCRSRMYTYMKTAVPGVFTYFSTRHNIVKDVTIVETNYTEYALLFKYKKFNREYTQVSLYGRTQTLRPELIEKFKKYAMQQGFPERSILTPSPPADNCPPSGQ